MSEESKTHSDYSDYKRHNASRTRDQTPRVRRFSNLDQVRRALAKARCRPGAGRFAAYRDGKRVRNVLRDASIRDYLTFRRGVDDTGVPACLERSRVVPLLARGDLEAQEEHRPLAMSTYGIARWTPRAAVQKQRGRRGLDESEGEIEQALNRFGMGIRKASPTAALSCWWLSLWVIMVPLMVIGYALYHKGVWPFRGGAGG